MPGTFTCCHCGTIVPRNPRLKKSQKYCSAASCQQARKNAWGKKEYRTNKTHRKQRLESQKACYAKRPGHAYQAAYREKHPEYDQRNRELQQKRNKRRSKDVGSMIVNTDALPLQASNDNAYVIISVKRGKIVNGTPFLAQMQILTGKEAIFRQIGN
jgi:hypothetical protein